MRFEGWLESGVVGVEGAGERVADLEGGGGGGGEEHRLLYARVRAVCAPPRFISGVGGSRRRRVYS